MDGWKPGISEKKFKFRNYLVYPFDLVHDVPCIGFYIVHEEMGSLVYLTDTEYCRYTFNGVNHIACECNFDKTLMDFNHPAKEHIFKGHMEKQTCIDFIKANKSKHLKNVILCHMSESNIDPEQALAEVQEIVGENVKCGIAKSGFEISLSLYPWE